MHYSLKLNALFSCQVAFRKALVQRTSRRRCFSATSSKQANPYPFPNSLDPTPYQIFHLQPDASPGDVKKRYYELVKLYHPDSAESYRYEKDHALRHAHFSAITRAYKSLQKRSTGDSTVPDSAEGHANPWRRAPHAYRRRYEEPRFVDDKWKDRLIWGGLFFAFVSVAAQVAMVRQRRTQLITERNWEKTLHERDNTGRRKEVDDDYVRLKGNKGQY